MLLYENGNFIMVKFKSSLLSQNFVLNRPSLILRSSSRYEADLVVSVVSFFSSVMVDLLGE